MAFLNLFSREKKQPTAMTADDRLSLVLSYQRSEIDEKKMKLFQQRLIQLCADFGYDVVGKVEVIPQSRERTTIIKASIPVKLKEPS